MRTPEAIVKDEIKRELRKRKIFSFWPVQFGMGAACVDCLLCHKGHFVGVEVKRPDGPGEPTARQQTVLDDIAASGGGHIVVRSWAEVKDYLDAI